jgi:D-amino-acid dehydrogenase
LHSAAFFAGDTTGNCRQFAQILKDRAVEAGAQFVFDTAVTSVKHSPRIELGLAGASATSQFDGVVFCTGSALTELATPLRIKVPLIEAHAFSLSAQMREPLNGPRSAVFDTKTNIGICRIGNRIRASGRAQIGGPSPRGAKKAEEQLYRAIQNHFPGAATLSNSTQFWNGRTLISVDAMPVIGETELPGVYLNIGHGFNGWGMACGSARLLAESVGKTAQAKQESGFSPRRFKR